MNPNNKVKLETQPTQNAAESFFEKNRKAILIIILAIVIIIAGIFCYNLFVSKPKAEKASTMLAKGQNYFQNGAYDLALKGDSATYMGFAKIADEYSGTDAGNLANLYAGLCSAYLNKWEDAEKFLSKFNPQNDALVSPAAISALANAYVHNGKIEKAIETFKKAAARADKHALDNKNYSLAPTFMLQAGMLLESQGNKEAANGIYTEIKEKYLNSALVQSKEIDKYIARTNQK